MGLKSDDDGDGGNNDKGILQWQSMIQRSDVLTEESNLLAKAIPVTYRFIHDLVYDEHSSKVDCNKYTFNK